MDDHCEHDYVYGGIKYNTPRIDGRQVNVYYDWFYCRKCAHCVYKRLDSLLGNVAFDATLMPKWFTSYE